MNDLENVLERYVRLHAGSEFPFQFKTFNSYAVTNFRGGIGKTTLSFNLAYELSKKHRMLFVDMCPQKNFSELLLKDDANKKSNRNIYAALLGKIMGSAWSESQDEDDYPLSLRVMDSNHQFQDSKLCHAIPGSSELFLFPSVLYTQLNQFYSMVQSNRERAVANLLNSLNDIIENEKRDLKSEVVLIDTSPFFGGGTHLAWAAAEALIIPVRVDEQSIFALELTLKMLHDENSDFNTWRKRANIEKKPKVQAIIMTHCGWNRQSSYQIDSTSKMYIERAINICNKYADCFSTDIPANHFALLSDFHSTGKISGSLSIPITKLVPGSFHTVDGKRLQVNDSDRYHKELSYVTNLISGE
jgi:cellulose biosynthesis protein BcsQ